MTTARLATLFKEQVERKTRSFDTFSDINVTGFKSLALDDDSVLNIIRGLAYLSHQPSLVLDLSDTQLSEESIRSVAQWLRSSNTPKKVDLILRNLTISDVAALDLAVSIDSPLAPKELLIDLTGCELSDASNRLLHEALDKKEAKNFKEAFELKGRGFEETLSLRI